MVKKNVDHLLHALDTKRKEFQALGEKIRSSAHSIVVCFIDLTDSTSAKSSLEPAEWLGYINEFLATTAILASEVGGKVIKRIGDELMVSFANTENSEQFLNTLQLGKRIRPESFKAALDYGEAYYLRFSKGLPDDPYGEVVDRCARIAKLAGPGTILCSNAYHRKVDGKSYIKAGAFALKGFSEPQEIFLRQPQPVAPEFYKPIIDALNRRSTLIESYATIPRKFDAAYLSSLGNLEARPFLARALLNVPHLPEQPQTILASFSGPNAKREMERVLGCYVDWMLIFKRFEISNGEINVYMDIPELEYNTVWVRVVPSMLEVVRAFSDKQKLRVRGIITRTYPGILTLNYADFEIVSPAPLSAVLAGALEQTLKREMPQKRSWWPFW